MASLDDLGRALRDDASTNAPGASVINVDAAISAARARRRPRQWAVGTLSVVAAIGLGGLAVAAVTPPTMIAATESADGADVLSEESGDLGGAPSAADEGERASGLIACGAVPPSPTQGSLKLELSVPTSAPATAGAVDGVVQIVNTGTDSVTIVTGTAASGVLIRDGVIVGTEAGRDGAALEFTLGAGESRELPVRIELTTCETNSEQPLPAGSYQVVVLVDVVDGAAVGIVVAPNAKLRID